MNIQSISLSGNNGEAVAGLGSVNIASDAPEFRLSGEGRRVTVKLYFREMLPYLLHKLLRSILLFHLRSSAKV